LEEAPPAGSAAAEHPLNHPLRAHRSYDSSMEVKKSRDHGEYLLHRLL